MKQARGKYLILAGLLITLSMVFYRGKMNEFPSFIHAWAQSDYYALAKGFIRNGFDFFHPRTFNLTPQFPADPPPAKEEGITRADFPLHPFLVAIAMKVFGTEAPWVYRWYVLLFSLAGLFFMARLSWRWSGSAVPGLFLAAFLFSSPLLAYYQNGFLSGIPSLAFCFAAFYFYFLHLSGKRLLHFFLAMALFSLAALGRTPFAIFLIGVICLEFVGWLMNRRADPRKLLALVPAVLVVAGYFLYNLSLGKTFGSIFLSRPYPPENLSELREIIRQVFLNWKFHYFSLAHYLVFFTLIIPAAVSFLKKQWTGLQNTVLLYLLIVLTGALIYAFLMGKQFVRHDYYFLDTFFPVAALGTAWLLSFLSGWIKARPLTGSTLAVMLVVAMTWLSLRTQHERRKTGFWDRIGITAANFKRSDVFLDSLGIARDAKILVLDAYAPNIPLILMDRQGYPVVNTSRDNIAEALDRNFDVVVAQDRFLASDVVAGYPEITDHLRRIAGNNRISVFEYLSEPQEQDLLTLLGFTGDELVFADSLDFSRLPDDRRWTKINLQEDSTCLSCPGSGLVERETQYGVTFRDSIPSSETESTIYIRFKGHFLSAGPLQQMYLVISLSAGGEQGHYQSYALEHYLPEPGKWTEFSFFTPVSIPAGMAAELSLYLWNAGGNELFCDDFRLGYYKRQEV